MRRWIALPLLAAAALAAGALTAPALAAPYREGPGPHAVAAAASLEIPDRARPLEVRATYPKAPGKYPVIVFSHGMFGSKDGYQPLARFWASHGYVVLQPTHPDSLRYGFQPQSRAVRAWDERPRQVSLLLDSLALLEKQAPALKGKLDTERIGVGGHSFGAHTAQLIGGAAAYARPDARKARSFRDRRVDAVLLISPQGIGGVFRKDSWKTLKKPMLLVTGSNDKGRKGEDPKWRLDPYQLSPPGDRYLVWLDGAHHGFGGISGVKWRGAGPRDEGQVRVVQQVTLAFFDAFLKGEEKARRWLRAGEIAKTKNAGVRAENRLPATGSSPPPDRRRPSR